MMSETALDRLAGLFASILSNLSPYLSLAFG